MSNLDLHYWLQRKRCCSRFRLRLFAAALLIAAIVDALAAIGAELHYRHGQHLLAVRTSPIDENVNAKHEQNGETYATVYVEEYHVIESTDDDAKRKNYTERYERCPAAQLEGIFHVYLLKNEIRRAGKLCPAQVA